MENYESAGRKGYRPRRNGASVPTYLGTQLPVLTPMPATDFLPDRIQSTFSNSSNIVNWLDAVQEFYRKLSEDDWNALSIVEFAHKIGRMPAAADGQMLQDAKSPIICRINDNLIDATRLREFSNGPRRICEGFSAADLLANHTITAIGQRAVRLVRIAPLLQDDLIGYVAVPRSDVKYGPSKAVANLPDQQRVPSISFAVDRSNFLVVDTDPLSALRRAADRTIVMPTIGPYERFKLDHPDLFPAEEPKSAGAFEPDTDMVVLRLMIPTGTAVLPVPFKNIDDIKLMAVMPLILPPGTVFGDVVATRLSRLDDSAVTQIRLQVPPQLPAVDQKYSQSDWPALPIVVPQPPVQTFVDLPLAVDIPTTTAVSCSTLGWLALFDEALKERGIPPTACYTKETWQDVALTERWMQTNKNLKDWSYDAETTRMLDIGLLLVAPDDESDIPAAIKSKLLWYRNPSSVIPKPVRIVTQACSKPFTLLPLVLIGTDETGRVGRHRNYLIFDHRTRLVERFEPHGAITGADFLNFADRLVPIVLQRIAPAYRYEPPSASCPVMPKDFLGPQALAAEATVGASGYCECFGHAYVLLRLLNPNWTPHQVKIQLNRAGRENAVSDFPRVTSAVFRYPPSSDNQKLLQRVSKEDRGLAIVRYIQMFYHWSQAVIKAKLRSIPRPLLPFNPEDEYNQKRPEPILVATSTPVPTPVPVASARPPSFGGGGGRSSSAVLRVCRNPACLVHRNK